MEWTIAADNAESREVVKSHKWGANYMVTSNGFAWYTPQGSASAAGLKYTSGYLQTSSGNYKTSACTVSIFAKYILFAANTA